jgi:L,D-transpeptidase ErfK/SrfK
MARFSTRLTALVVALGAGVPAAASPPAIGTLQTYRGAADDSLVDLARKYDLGYDELAAANPRVKPLAVGEGTEILLPLMHLLPRAPHEGIVVNIAEMRLYYFPQKDGTPESFPLGIGEEGSVTPTGQTRVTRKEANPVWYRTASEIKAKPWAPKIVPPGPDNPLGAFALHLGWPAFLIHGTDDWRGVGLRDSRGCMRLYPEDIEKLFAEVKIGTKVTVVNQPIKLAWIDDRLFLEVHPTPHQADQFERGEVPDYEDPVGVVKTILAAAPNATDRLDWEAVRQAINDRSGIPVAITR